MTLRWFSPLGLLEAKLPGKKQFLVNDLKTLYDLENEGERGTWNI